MPDISDLTDSMTTTQETKIAQMDFWEDDRPETPQATVPCSLPTPDESARICEKLESLSGSRFRASFHLRKQQRRYIDEKGLDTIVRHACDFIRLRLAPAHLPNDGRQTPMRGHPVFIAQHATGTCCRKCLSKWHGIEPGHALTPQQQHYIVNLIMAWIHKEIGPALPQTADGCRQNVLADTKKAV